MNTLRLFAALLIASIASGCVTIAGNHLSDLERTVPKEVPRVEHTIGDFSFHLDGGKMITSIKAGRELNHEILERWKDWGYISSETYVKSSQFSGSAGYEITLSGNQNGDSSIPLQILSGLTLIVIPYYVDTRFRVGYDVRDVRTGQTWHAEVEDSFNTIISWLFLPFIPFSGGGMSSTYDRVAAHLYDSLKSQGAFAGT
jgi:hypothetical protein